MPTASPMSRDTTYPVIADTFLFLRPQDHPAGRAGRDRTIGFLRLAKAANLRDRLGADHAGAKAAGALGRGPTDAASSSDQQNRLAGLEPCRFNATPGGQVVDPNRRGLVEAEVVGLPA